MKQIRIDAGITIIADRLTIGDKQEEAQLLIQAINDVLSDWDSCPGVIVDWSKAKVTVEET